MAHVREKPQFEAWFTAHVGRNVKQITNAVRDDMIAGCPVDSGDLVSTIKSKFPGRLRGVVSIGGKAAFGDAPYWYFVVYGTSPHWIVSTGSWSLHDAETGRYFGRRVWHPGTQAQPFPQEALYQRRKLTRGGR